MPKQCGICMTNITPIRNKEITCTICEMKYCTNCLKQYIISKGTSEVKCMKQDCDFMINRSFIARHLSMTFIATTLKEYEIKNYKTMIMSLTKDTLYNIITTRQKNSKNYFMEIHELCKLINTTGLDNTIEHYSNDKKFVRDMIAYEIGSKVRLYKDIFFRSRYGNVINPTTTTTPTTPTTPTTTSTSTTSDHLTPCGDITCKGVLVNEICNICNKKICNDCMVEIKEGHVCKESDISTTKELKKTSKPCPNCKAPIHKTYGCNQMWCTNCNTAFNWATLKIISTRNGYLNPEHTEYLNRIRNAGSDNVCFMYSRRQLELDVGIFQNANPGKCGNEIGLFYRLVRSFDRILNECTNTLSRNTNIERNNILYNYITTDISSDDSMKNLYKLDINNAFAAEMAPFIRLIFVEVSFEIRNLLLGKSCNLNLTQLKRLIDFYNTESEKIRKIYGKTKRDIVID